MTHEAREESNEDGAPILLATFALGEKVWRFARADQDVLHGGNTYLTVPGGMEPTRFRDSSETQKNDVKLTVDRHHPIAELWRVSPPTGIVAVLLTEIHEGEPEGATSWLGHVSNVSWVGEAMAEISLSPGALAMRTNGLRRLWQKSCAHVLYGPKCKLARRGAPIEAELEAVDDTELTAAGFDQAEDLVGGALRWIDGDGIPHVERILAHAGDTITVGAAHASLEVGAAVAAFVGGHEVVGVLDAVDGTLLTIPAAANGMKFNGGFVEWTTPDGITDWRAIIDHAGDQVRLMTQAPLLEVGMVLTVVEGCDRTITRCEELENTNNFGGVPYFMNKNPFGNDPIY